MIPIFIITRDRVTVLKKSIASYLPLGDIEIVIHDNNSTYPPMIKYLKELESSGIHVRRYGNREQDVTVISELVQNTIDEWYVDHDSPYYIVTDPDIELEHPSPELLEVYKAILNRVEDCVCVGPMLRIDDLPECFHFRDQMIRSHMEQFWGAEHRTKVFRNTLIQAAAIDTTFAMYRKEFRFNRLNMGIRVHEPYMAKHLDWYIDTKNPSDEQMYYMSRASNVSTMTSHIRNGGMG